MSNTSLLKGSSQMTMQPTKSNAQSVPMKSSWKKKKINSMAVLSTTIARYFSVKIVAMEEKKMKFIRNKPKILYPLQKKK